MYSPSQLSTKRSALIGIRQEVLDALIAVQKAGDTVIQSNDNLVTALSKPDVLSDIESCCFFSKLEMQKVEARKKFEECCLQLNECREKYIRCSINLEEANKFDQLVQKRLVSIIRRTIVVRVV